ncbi:MAG TPA: ABC transporter permease [Kofleriaceae bacterium]|nr:ABC transporter permease [Kofleriaceae bacterium]
MSAGAVVRGLVTVARKEMIQTLRDRRMVFMLIAAPVIQLVMFGFAVDLEVDHIPTALCDQDHSTASRALAQALFAGDTFREHDRTDDPEHVQAELESGDAAAAIVIPRGYARQLARGEAPDVQILVDATDATRAQVAAQDATQFLAARAVPGAAAAAPLVPRVLYNQRLKTPVYMVPGILATLLLNITAVVTAMGLARERETGTLEQILVTPIHPATLLAGKCLPFILFGLIDVVAILVLGTVVFDVPIQGSLGLLGLAAFLYLFSSLGTGILIATLSASQQQAMLGALAVILPAMLMSGFLSPIASMPGWLQPLTLLNPMRHFLEILRRCLLKGAGFADLAPQLAALAILGTALLAISALVFRRRLV